MGDRRQDMTKFGFAKLGHTNYPSWSKQVESLLATKGCQAALTDPADPNSAMAKGLIGLCVQDCHLSLVSRAQSAQAAWQSLANLYQQQSSANILRLKRDFANLEKKRDETITEFVARVTDLREQIQAATGNPMQDADVIVVLLSGLPTRYAMIKTVIEAAPALPTLAEVQAKLLNVEADKTRGNESAHFNSSSSSQTRPFGGALPRVYVPPHKRNSRYGGMGMSSSSSSFGRRSYTPGTRESRLCFYCNKPGHLKKDCRKLKADNMRSKGKNSSSNTPTVVALSAITTEADEDYEDGYYYYNPYGYSGNLDYTADFGLYSPADYDGGTDYSYKSTIYGNPFDKEDPINIWWLDSGASKHSTGNQEILHNYRELPQDRTITYGNKTEALVNTCGDVILDSSCSPNIKLVMKDVLYSKDNAFNLLSVSAAAANGVEFIFTADHCQAYKNGELILEAVKHSNGLYKVLAAPIYPKQQPISDSMLAASSNSYKDPHLWHRRLGHIGYSSLKKMAANSMVEGLPLSAEDIDNAKEACDICLKTKGTRQPFKPSESKTEAPLELIHMDLCGPLDESLGKSKYIATFLDDYSDYSAVVLLKQKSDTHQAVKNMFNLLETQTGRKIKAARSDNGGEYVSTGLSDYFKEKGINHQKTMPYSPQSNGKAERLNRTLMEKARAMLSEANLPESLWGEAITTANYLRNRSPTANSDKTPWERMFGKKPDLSNLRTFGSKAFVHIPKKKRNKLGDTAEKGIMVGYEPKALLH